MWTPDTYIVNAVSSNAPAAPKPQKSTRIYKTGLIVQKTRLSLTTSCLMNLQSFPFDKESCAIKFQSYAYPMTEVKYKWKPQTNGTLTSVRRRLAYVHFDFIKPIEKVKNTEIEGETKSHLGFRMFFDRPLWYYVTKFYVPLIFLVHFSWIAFFMGRGAMPARVMVVVTALMTINSFNTSTESSLPKTGSITVKNLAVVE